MFTDFEGGMATAALAILIFAAIFAFGYSIQAGIIRNDINLCGHTLECYEKVVFPPKEKS